MLLPFDGAAMTPVAKKAMDAGIPVINVDREFSDPNAARVTVLGDNYGMGVSAGQYVCEQLGDKPDAVVAEIAGIDSLPLTQDRSKGFKDALASATRPSTTAWRPTSRWRAASAPPPTCSRPPRRSTPSGTTTTTRASACWPRSRTPTATSSSWSAGPVRPTPCARSSPAQGVLKATVIYPVHAERRRHQARPAAGAGQGPLGPGGGRGAAHHPAVRPGGHCGERRPVPGLGLRVLIDPTRSRTPSRPGAGLSFSWRDDWRAGAPPVAVSPTISR